MWSVLTGPYFVITVLPSTIGRISLCTPCLETSPLPLPSLSVILSISSIKIIPLFSTFSTTSWARASKSIFFSTSSSKNKFRAFRTVVVIFFNFPGRVDIIWSTSPPISSLPDITSIIGISLSFLGLSISISVWSYFPSANSFFIISLSSSFKVS